MHDEQTRDLNGMMYYLKGDIWSKAVFHLYIKVAFKEKMNIVWTKVLKRPGVPVKVGGYV